AERLLSGGRPSLCPVGDRVGQRRELPNRATAFDLEPPKRSRLKPRHSKSMQLVLERADLGRWTPPNQAESGSSNFLDKPLDQREDRLAAAGMCRILALASGIRPMSLSPPKPAIPGSRWL